MKIKDLSYETAKIVCERHMRRYNEDVYACKTCPLYLNDNWFCGKSFAYINEKYGNDEINLKEREENGSNYFKYSNNNFNFYDI